MTFCVQWRLGNADQIISLYDWTHRENLSYLSYLAPTCRILPHPLYSPLLLITHFWCCQNTSAKTLIRQSNNLGALRILSPWQQQTIQSHSFIQPSTPPPRTSTSMPQAILVLGTLSSQGRLIFVHFSCLFQQLVY